MDYHKIISREEYLYLTDTYSNVEELISKYQTNEEKIVILLLLVNDKAESDSNYTSRESNYFYGATIISNYSENDLIDLLQQQDLNLFQNTLIDVLLSNADKFSHSRRDEYLESVAKIINDNFLSKVVSCLYRNHKNSLFENKWINFNKDLKKFGLNKQKTLLEISAQVYETLHDLFVENNGWSDIKEQRKFILRRQVANLFKENKDILIILLEGILEDFQEIEDELVIILTNTIGSKDIKYLKEISKTNPDKNVRLLAEIICANLDGTFSEEMVPSSSFSNISQTVAYYENMIGSQGKAYKGRTWLKDELIEQIFHDAYSKTDREFSEYYTNQVGKREEGLTENLVVTLENNFLLVRASIKKWSEKIVKNKVKVKFSYRDVQKQEDDWQADIAFLFNCSINKNFVKKHGVLIQCKQMNATKTGVFQKTWTIDIEQCRDLIKISPFSYYFLYGPSKLPQVNILVVPATTIAGFLDATAKRTQKAKNISFEDIRPNSRTLADFLLYDFIGCWNGDSNETLTNFAAGSVNVRPLARFLVETSISIGTTENNR